MACAQVCEHPLGVVHMAVDFNYDHFELSFADTDEQRQSPSIDHE